jgi:hypothetical protein
MGNLNNNEHDCRNRGTEIMLKKKGGDQSEAIDRKFCFEQTLSLFKREFTFRIEFFVKKTSNPQEKKRC